MNHQQKGKQYMSLKSTPALTYYYWKFHHNLWHTCNKLHLTQHVKYFNLVLAFNLLEKHILGHWFTYMKKEKCPDFNVTNLQHVRGWWWRDSAEMCAIPMEFGAWSQSYFLCVGLIRVLPQYNNIKNSEDTF